MKKSLSLLFMFISWATIIAQLILMIQNRVAPVGETLIRFFSFFTILTNILVAVYFSAISLSNNSGAAFFKKPGMLTAITVYISIVSLVYQIVLRPLWHPEGMQKIVDELLHTIIPFYTFVFWLVYEQRTRLRFTNIPRWLIYPLLYLIFILIRGSISNYYPYPFMDVSKLGFSAVMLNSLYMLIAFSVVSVLFVIIHNALTAQKKSRKRNNEK